VVGIDRAEDLFACSAAQLIDMTAAIHRKFRTESGAPLRPSA
jgi:hypothetical protein